MSPTQHTCFGLLNKSKGRGLPGHSSVLQTIVSSRAGHFSPLCSGSWTTSLFIVLLPPPQVALHSLPALHGPTLQSTKDPQFSKDVRIMIKKPDEKRVPGQWSALQILVCSRAGHVSPPCFGCWMTSRVLVLVPLPQATSQSLHADQSSTLQSTEDPQLVKIWWWKWKSKMERLPGHSSVLHASVSSRSGQEAPASFASLITSRPLFLLPPPQVTLHLPQGFQSPTLQSTGNVKLWWEIKEQIFAIIATMIALHFQITPDCGAHA